MTWPTRAAGLVAAVGSSALLAGCVSLPTSGPIEQVAPRGADADVLVQVAPSGPLAGASPTEVVSGFLTAMQSFPVSTRVAREFLTPRADLRWEPERRTVVYTTSSVSQDREVRRESQVVLRTAEQASLDERGSYRPAPSGGTLTRTFDLARTEAGWRIVDPPDALLLSASFFQEYFRPFDLYFFDPTGTALIPDPVWLPLGDQLTTRLAYGLLAGPTRTLRGQAVTTVSARSRVQVSAPLGDDGVVDVELSEPVTGLSSSQRELLSAQLVWTLSQATGVEGVQLGAEGAPLAVPGAEPVQSIESWPEYDPSDPGGLGARSQLYGIRRGHVVAVDADSTTRLSGWWGGRGRAVTDLSVMATLDRIAVTDRSRRQVLVGPYAAERRAVSPWYRSDGTLRHPHWDRTGQLWVLERTARSQERWTRLVVVDDGVEQRVPGGVSPAVEIRSFALSADGARIALLVDRWPGRWLGGVRQPPADGPILVVARVVRAADGRTVRRLDQPYAVPAGAAVLGDLRALAWGAPSTLSVLGRLADEPTQVYRVPIDGSPIAGGILSGESVLGPVGAVGLTATGVSAPVVADRRGRLFALDSQAEWAEFAAGVRQPRYPD